MSETFSPFGGALLLVVDVQPVFLKSLPEPTRLLKRVSFAVEAAKLLHMPIGFTEQVPQRLGGTCPELLALPDNPHVFPKSTFSAIADDGILDALRTLGVEHLILCGLETSICVYQTAVDAIHANFQVTVLTDAVGCRRPEDAVPCLETLVRAGAYVLPSETVFYSMVGTATHPAFKPFTQLVKNYA